VTGWLPNAPHYTQDFPFLPPVSNYCSQMFERENGFCVRAWRVARVKKTPNSCRKKIERVWRMRFARDPAGE
jgi:hypothetical protein